MMKYSILIPTYNRRDLLTSLMKSIRKFSGGYCHEDYEIIVLDNSCGRMRKLNDWKPDRWVEIGENLGNVSVNRGAHLALGEFLIILNDDTEIFGLDWMKMLHDGWRVGDNVGMVSTDISKLVLENNGFKPGGSATANEKYAYAEMWCCLIPKELYIKSGGICEDIKLVYGEDVDLSWKVRGLGYKLAYAPGIPIKHLRFGTTKHGSPIKAGDLCRMNLKTIYDRVVDNKYQLFKDGL